jgi:NitT/TauT family transport system substrate-binding protein
VIVAVVGLLSTACGSDEASSDDGGNDTAAPAGDETSADGGTAAPADDGELPVVRMQGLVNGMAALSLAVIEERGLDEAHGFQGEYAYIPPDASLQNFLNEESDVAFDVGPPDLAVSRTQDYDVRAFSLGSGNHVRIITKAEAPYETIEDLQGMTVGHYGDDSTGTLSVSLLLSEYKDLDFFTDFNLVLASPAALVDLLEAGEIDAAMTFEPHVSRAKATIDGGIKVVYDPGQVWQDETGGLLPTTTLAARDSWIADNPDVAQSVLDAWCEASEYINSNPEELVNDPAYEELLGLDDAGKEAFATYLSEREPPLFSCGLGEDTVDNISRFVDLLADQGILFDANPGGVVAPLDTAG